MDFELLRILTHKNLLTRYRSALLGYWWDVALAIGSALFYAGAFQALGVRRAPGSWPVFLIGVASWHWTAGVVASSSTLYARNAKLLRRLPIRWNEHVAACVLGEAAPLAALLSICLAGALACRSFPGWQALLALPLAALAQAAALSGWVSSAGAAGAVLRDVDRLCGLLAKALFFATPVAFDPALLPAALRPWLLLNPAAVFVEMWRAALEGRLEPTLLGAAAAHALFGILLGALIAGLFSPRLAEYA